MAKKNAARRADRSDSIESTYRIEEYTVTEKPYYLPIRNEVEVFEAAYKNRLPVMLKGPTGCGKTRFIQYMAWKLKKPLITVHVTMT